MVRVDMSVAPSIAIWRAFIREQAAKAMEAGAEKRLAARKVHNDVHTSPKLELLHQAMTQPIRRVDYLA